MVILGSFFLSSFDIFSYTFELFRGTFEMFLGTSAGTSAWNIGAS